MNGVNCVLGTQNPVNSLETIARHQKRPHSLRRILIHMIEETARHNGHADLMREYTDGQTGSAVLPVTPWSPRTRSPSSVATKQLRMGVWPPAQTGCDAYHPPTGDLVRPRGSTSGTWRRAESFGRWTASGA